MTEFCPMKKVISVLTLQSSISEPFHIKLDGTVENVKTRRLSILKRAQHGMQFVLLFLFSPLP